jgi:hypothetical protein
MPLRKSGSIVGTTAAAIAISAALVPATAQAGLFSSLLGGGKTTSTTGTTVTATASTTTPSPAITVSNTAAATSACTPMPTTKSFQRVDGDTSDYSPAPDGGFEAGGAGWSFTGGAKVVTGNETLGVLSGKKSLMMPLNATATSPAFCVDETNPHFRFTYKVDNASLSGFLAYVIFRDNAGKITSIELVSSKGISLAPTLWQASPKSPLATLIPLNGTTKSATVQLKIIALSPVDLVKDFSDAIIGANPLTGMVTQVGGAATGLVSVITGTVSTATNIGVKIDSVMVDPYRRG